MISLENQKKAKEDYDDYYNTVLIPKYKDGFKAHHFCRDCPYKCKHGNEIDDVGMSINAHKVWDRYWKYQQWRKQKIHKRKETRPPIPIKLDLCMAILMVTQLIPCPTNLEIDIMTTNQTGGR